MRPRTLARVIGILLLLGLLLALQGLYSHLTRLQREGKTRPAAKEPRVIYEMPELEKALRRQAEERARQRREEEQRAAAPPPAPEQDREEEPAPEQDREEQPAAEPPEQADGIEESPSGS